MARETAHVINSYFRKHATHVETCLALRRMTAMRKLVPCNRMALMACLFDWNTIYVRANRHMGFKNSRISSYTRLEQLNVPRDIVKPIELYPKKLRRDLVDGYMVHAYHRTPFTRLVYTNYVSEMLLLHKCLHKPDNVTDDSQLDTSRLEANIDMLLRDVM